MPFGFDHFYGYNCQRHAHSYFPSYLYDDDRRISLEPRTYAQELIQKDTENWIRKHKDGPFFLFYAITLPHAKLEIDDQGIYKDKPWGEDLKNYAAMVTRLDSDVGRLLALLKELNIDGNTLVMVSGDNGSSYPPQGKLGKFFGQSENNKLRGYKRGLYEGGLRQASIARWPGVVKAGRVSAEPWAFWDVLPTAADLAGLGRPPGYNGQGLSLASFLKGGPAPQREYFYWELHEGKPIQAVRFGDWKAVRNGPDAKVELYDLANDVSEAVDLAAKHPELVGKAATLMASARVADPAWPLAVKGKAEGNAGGNR